MKGFLIAIVLFFILISNLWAQESAANDTIDESIRVYDKLCPILGGDSIRYANGVKCVGLMKDYYPNKVLKHKGYYDQGQIVTVFTNYYDNGAIERNFAIKTESKGTLELFYRNGKIKAKGEYVKGEMLKWEDYYENGQLEFAEEYNRGLDHHLYTRFYFENGTPKVLFELTDAKKRIYTYKEFYENGHLKEEGIKIQNKSSGDYMQDGDWKYYDESGKLTLIENYISGSLNEEQKF